jgi:hypothetical protein
MKTNDNYNKTTPPKAQPNHPRYLEFVSILSKTKSRKENNKRSRRKELRDAHCVLWVV